MTLTFLILSLFSAVVSWAACHVVKRYGASIGLIDKPGFRKIHTVPIPTGGGLGIWLGVVVPFALITLAALMCKTVDGQTTLLGVPITQYLPQAVAMHIPGLVSRLTDLWTLLGLGTILVVLGTIDDRKGLDWKLRLGIEFLVAASAVSYGWRATFFIDVPFLTWLVSVFWIVGLINSFNMLDNMDALSGGVATICSLFLAAVAFVFAPNPFSGEPQYFLGGFLLILAGAILGFLKLNKPPAKMFMGDGGAYFIGFLLATTTLSITFVGESTPKTAIFVPLCVLAVPLYDTISVVTIRIKHGASPFVGDNNHYSHRLVALGLSKPQAVATIYLTTAVCAIGAFCLYQASFGVACLVFLQTLLVLTLVAILEFAARKKIRQEHETALKNEEAAKTLKAAKDQTQDEQK